MILSSFGGVSTTSGSSSTVITPPASSKVVCAGGLVLSKVLWHNEIMDVIKACEMGIADQVWQPSETWLPSTYINIQGILKNASGHFLFNTGDNCNVDGNGFGLSLVDNNHQFMGVKCAAVSANSVTFRGCNKTGRVGASSIGTGLALAYNSKKNGVFSYEITAILFFDMQNSHSLQAEGGRGDAKYLIFEHFDLFNVKAVCNCIETRVGNSDPVELLQSIDIVIG